MIRDYTEHVYKTLGPGFSERIYHNALEVVLRKNGVHYETERIVPIVFEGHTIGNLRADLILNNKTVVELKSVKTMNDVMITQAQNYLKLTGLPEAYLINFPPTLNTELEVRYVTLDVPSDSSCT
jgi:GxxExxY protein